ncbi:hypothetical protein T11_9693, partial [Trichinella zimbabwensis]
DVGKHFFGCIREENVPGTAVQSNSRVVQCSTVENIGAVNNEPATSSNQIKEWSNSRINFHRVFLLVVIGVYIFLLTSNDVDRHFFGCIRKENVPGTAVQSSNRVVQYSTVEKIGAVNNEPATSSNQIKELSNSRINFHRVFLLVVIGGVI